MFFDKRKTERKGLLDRGPRLRTHVDCRFMVANVFELVPGGIKPGAILAPRYSKILLLHPRGNIIYHAGDLVPENVCGLHFIEGDPDRAHIVPTLRTYGEPDSWEFGGAVVFSPDSWFADLTDLWLPLFDKPIN